MPTRMPVEGNGWCEAWIGKAADRYCKVVGQRLRSHENHGSAGRTKGLFNPPPGVAAAPPRSAWARVLEKRALRVLRSVAECRTSRSLALEARARIDAYRLSDDDKPELAAGASRHPLLAHRPSPVKRLRMDPVGRRLSAQICCITVLQRAPSAVEAMLDMQREVGRKLRTFWLVRLRRHEPCF